MSSRPFGTHPDLPDHRDHAYLIPRRFRKGLPGSIDLRPQFPGVYDQGALNSCSANAIAGAMWLDELRQHGQEAPTPSRLFIYYNERVKEGVSMCNRPVSLRDGYNSVASAGVCPEPMWPYRFDKFDVKPPLRCYRAARKRRVTRYLRLRRDLGDMKACLAEGFPFAFGASVFKSFKSHRVARTGIVPMPTRGEPCLGGHAMLVVGYDDRREMFVVRNSWGRRWGVQGYCFFSYAQMMHPTLSWDFWTARIVA